MLILTKIKRLFIKTIKSFKRNRWSNLATISALALIFIMVNITNALTYFSANVISNVENKVDILVPLKSDINEIQRENFLANLENQKTTGAIKNFKFYSKEQELEDFRKKHKERVVFLKMYNLPNPMTDIVQIIPEKNKINHLMSYLTASYNKNIIDTEFLDKHNNTKQRVSNFVTIARFIEQISSGIFIFFLIISIALIFHSTNLTLKKSLNEIYIMKLVGAKFSTIRNIFILPLTRSQIIINCRGSISSRSHCQNYRCTACHDITTSKYTFF